MDGMDRMDGVTGIHGVRRFLEEPMHGGNDGGLQQM